MRLFVVKDMKAQIHLSPFFNKTVAEALRGWQTIANEGESMISKFANDFRLFELAQFDEITGRLEQYELPKDLGSAADYKNKPMDPLPLLKSASQ